MHRHEFKQNHLEWINAAKPNLDPVISAQMQGGPEITDSNIENCHAVRNEMRSALNDLLKVSSIGIHLVNVAYYNELPGFFPTHPLSKYYYYSLVEVGIA